MNSEDDPCFAEIAQKFCIIEGETSGENDDKNEDSFESAEVSNESGDQREIGKKRKAAATQDGKDKPKNSMPCLTI